MPMIIDGTNGGFFPSWTTATRPASPAVGQMGYNTTTGAFDAYTVAGWVSVASSATAPVNGPAFSAYANTTQAINASTWTKVNFANERFDTNSNFASSRFTPTVAGYYLLSSNVYFDSNPAGQVILNLSINGAGSSGYGLNRFITTGAGQLSGSMLVYLNGSTDYAEIYYYSTGANTLNSGTSDTLVMFNGGMVRSA